MDLISATSVRNEWELCELSGYNSLADNLQQTSQQRSKGKQAHNMEKRTCVNHNEACKLTTGDLVVLVKKKSCHCQEKKIKYARLNDVIPFLGGLG
jgi:hypothetical protein